MRMRLIVILLRIAAVRFKINDIPIRRQKFGLIRTLLAERHQFQTIESRRLVLRIVRFPATSKSDLTPKVGALNFPQPRISAPGLREVQRTAQILGQIVV